MSDVRQILLGNVLSGSAGGLSLGVVLGRWTVASAAGPPTNVPLAATIAAEKLRSQTVSSKEPT